MRRFDYVLERIRSAPFVDVPFRHIYIEDLFTNDDLEELLSASDNAVPEVSSDADLLEQLFNAGYKVIDFPGCITDKAGYLAWRASHESSHQIHSACDGFGMALRLTKPRSSICGALKQFVNSADFGAVLAEKFHITLDDCHMDGGIQKYLDGYEISPHADIRRKALTFMVNINPHKDSENLNHHTHYLRFKDQYKYVQVLWEFNAHVERCWVPWRWCDTHAIHNKNNTMVMFAPSDSTLHGVKAAYNHLKGQRTQLYGNLWYNRYAALKSVEWEELDILADHRRRSATSLKRRLIASIPAPAKTVIGRALGTSRLR